MSVLNKLRKLWLLTATKEASYGAGGAGDSLLSVDLAAMVNPVPALVNDADQIGSGLEEPSTQELVALHNVLALNTSKCKPHLLATAGAFGMGAISSALAGAAPSTYKHEITPLATLDLPTTVAEALFTSGVQQKYPGVIVNDFTLRVNRGANRLVGINANLLLSGNRSSGSASASEKAEAIINSANAGIWLGAVDYSGSTDDDLDTTTTDLSGSPTDISNDVRSLEWGYNNNINPEDLYRIGSGNFFGASERDVRSQSVALTFDYADHTHIYRLEAQTEVALQWKIRGPQSESGFYYGFNLIFPALRYNGAEVVEQAGKLVNQCNFLVQDEATYGSVLLVVFNQQAAYAAAA